MDVVSGQKAVVGKVYSFPYSNQFLKNVSQKRDKFIMKIAVPFGVLIGVVAFIWFINIFDLSTSKTPAVFTWLLILLSSLSACIGMVGGMFCGIATAIILDKTKSFAETEYGDLVIANWEDFGNWMNWEFNIKVADIVPRKLNEQAAEFFWMHGGDINFNFQDVDGEKYVLIKEKGVDNSFTVTHLSYSVVTASPKTEMHVRLETKVDSGFKPVHLKPEETVERCEFKELMVLDKDVLPAEINNLVTEMKETFNVLGACALVDDEVAGVRRIHEELDDLCLMVLQVLPVGLDEDLEAKVISGFTCLRDELLSIKNEYRDSLRDDVSQRLEMFNVIFDSATNKVEV